MGTRVRIRNVDEQIQSWEIEDIFTAVGDVSSVSIEQNVAIDEMKTEQDALDCIARFNGYKVAGTIWVVSEDGPHVPSADFLNRKKRRADATKRRARA